MGLAPWSSTERATSPAPRPAVRADAAQLPFPGSTFDGAAALFVLYHLGWIRMAATAD